MNKKLKLLLPVLFAGLVLTQACNRPGKTHDSGMLSGDLVIFHAGSLSIPIKMLADSFRLLHPGVTIKSESAGSLASIRKITDLNRPCDILASADYILIDKLMIPGHADWNLLFAGNEMAIVYHEKSRYAREINQNNWHEILMRPDVSYGRSDPDSDPCGYRAILSMKLAEAGGLKTGFTRAMLEKDRKYIRPKEVDLLALLESGALDYIFLYRSVAIQHKLPYLELPDSINLSDPDLNAYYSTVSVDIAGNRPGESITQKGEAMIYGLTIPKNNNNPEAAEAFIKFLTGPGMNLIEKAGQVAIKPIPSEGSILLPTF